MTTSCSSFKTLTQDDDEAVEAVRLADLIGLSGLRASLRACAFATSLDGEVLELDAVAGRSIVLGSASDESLTGRLLAGVTSAAAIFSPKKES